MRIQKNKRKRLVSHWIKKVGCPWSSLSIDLESDLSELGYKGGTFLWGSKTLKATRDPVIVGIDLAKIEKDVSKVVSMHRGVLSVHHKEIGQKIGHTGGLVKSEITVIDDNLPSDSDLIKKWQDMYDV